MDRNVRSPGPANDGLNKLFPGMERSLAVQNTSPFSDITASHSNGLDHLGGSIETWVRKLANKASSSLQPPNSMSSTNGDLIELSEDAFEPAIKNRLEDSNVRGRSQIIDSSSRSLDVEGVSVNSLGSRGVDFQAALRGRD